jgi:hypothetical protein
MIFLSSLEGSGGLTAAFSLIIGFGIGFSIDFSFTYLTTFSDDNFGYF